MKALQQSKNRLLFIWIGRTTLKCFNELQSHCAKNGSDHQEAFDLIATSIFYFLHASLKRVLWTEV